jgi:hypothetical protein
VYTVFALYHLMSNRVSYEGICAALQPGSRRFDKRRVERVCRAFTVPVFGDEQLTAGVLYENTLFGALCRGLSTDAQVTIANAMIAGPQADEPGWLLRSFASRVRSIWTRAHRSCPKCVEEDLDEQGFPAWRVLHEIAQVDRCVYHGCALQPDLPAAGGLGLQTYYNRLPNIVHDGRWCALEGDAVPRSAGCSRYLEGWLRAFRGETPVLAVDNWIQAVASAIATTGSRGELHAVLESHIVREWEGTLADVAGWLRIRSASEFLDHELALATHPGCLAQRIVAMGSLEAVGLITDSSRPQAEFLFYAYPPQGEMARADRSPVQAFCRTLLDAGYPPSVVDALARGLPRAQIDKLVGSCSGNVSVLLAVMSDELIAKLSECRDWPEDSWIRSAMRDRQAGRRARPQSRSKHRMFDHLIKTPTGSFGD